MSDVVDGQLTDITEALQNPQFTVINRGFDDKHNVICTAVYSDNTSSTFLVAAIVGQGKSVSVNLKDGVTVSSFTVFCTYDGHLRQCGTAEATSKGFRRCALWWAASGPYEEVLAFGS